MNRIAAIIVFFITIGHCTAETVDGEIVKSGAVKSNINLSGFRSAGGVSAVFLETLKADLIRSGWFAVVESSSGSLEILGSCVEAGQSLKVQCTVGSTSTHRRYLHESYTGRKADVHRLAHRLADEIVWAVRGVKGISSSRIVMIGSRAEGKDVYMCDYDGKNIFRVTKEGAVCLAPSWGAGGKTLVYTSFHGGFPDVYIMDLESNIRRKLASYPGLNAGADISPDGSSMVLTLSKDGNPDLYIMKLRSGRITRLTRTKYAAEASPSWSPDGKRIVFVSDKSRSPQLYIISARGGEHRRITFSGSQNVAPDWGPGGEIAYSSRTEGRYHICVIDPDTGRVRKLTKEYVDHEDPSWAPDGRHIVFTRTQSYQSHVYILDTMGDPPVRLTTLSGQWHSPSWSP